MVKQTIYITSNPDLSPIESYWVTGSIIDQIFKNLKINIKPEIAVNVRPDGYEIHLDSDNTMQWQFYLRIAERKLNGKQGLQFSIDLLYDSAKGTQSGIIKTIMESTYFTIPKKYEETYNETVLLEAFFIYLNDALKNRVFV